MAYPKVKLSVDDSGNIADTGLGVYGAQTLRVTIAANDALLTSMNTNLGDIEALLTTIDGDTGGALAGIKINNDTFNSGHYGHVVLGTRNDELAALTGVADGDYSLLQVNALGALYTTGGEVENAAVQSEPTLIGGRYDSSARTLGNGDAGAIALNASGHALVDGSGVTQPVSGTITVNAHAVTIDDTSFAVADGNALGEGILVQGDDGSDRKNIHVDATTGDVQVDVTNTVTVDGSGVTQPVSGTFWQGTQPISGTVTANAGSGTMTVDGSGVTQPISGSVTVSGTATVTQASAARTVTGDVGHNITGMQSDNNEGVDDTTAEVLKASTVCKRVDMQADSANTGYIYVGGSDVSAVKGIRLAPGDFYSIDIDNTADIYVLASVDEEDIHFTYYT